MTTTQPTTATDALPVVPPELRIGVATSAYQIEGAVDVDGRGPSIWDTFCRLPGRTLGGHTGDVAVDHYHRLEADLDLLAWLGIDHYRFSISWPRILPRGHGRIEPRGLAFYDRLVDGLLERGIEPVATLYHWDLPQALQEDGGWAVPQTADRFAAYAARTVRHLGDRVRTWATLNEPWCSAFLGHDVGVHAPGIQDPGTAVAAAHHLVLGHARAVAAMRAERPDVDAGIVLNLAPIRPASDSDADANAVRRADGIRNRWWLDPVLHGSYPQDVLASFEAIVDLGRLITPEQVADLGQPCDWLGLNYYTPEVVAAGTGAAPPGPGLDGVVSVPPTGGLTTMGWAVDPSGLIELLERLRDAGAPPVMITECGAAYDDTVVDGVVDDPERVAWMADHVAATLEARERGVDVRGFTVWSLMDNFEWAEGYTQRFGIVHVDLDTLQRTPKTSAHWLRDVVAARDQRHGRDE